MKYDFSQIVNRRNTGSYKWDHAADGVLPLWVADMDFPTAPCVRQAVERRAAHGIFGYVSMPDSYYEAIASWFSRRHNWHVDRQNIIYTIGVVPAISAIIKAMTNPGDKVLVNTPVYNCFFSSIRNNGCQLEASPLIFENNTYRVDFEDFERRCADPLTKVFLLCNPHNPAGRVWTRDELMKMAEICMRHDVFVISDEIHCEIVMPGHRYTPYATLGTEFERRAAICISPSKAFNIAGLQIANISAIDEDIRRRIDKAININEVCDVNPFGVEALIAAYSEDGEEWLGQLNAYIYDNYLYAKKIIEQRCHLQTATLEGTYLLWVEMSRFGMTSEELEEAMKEKVKLWLNAGSMYGDDRFMRINLACPRPTLEEALNRFERFCKMK